MKVLSTNANSITDHKEQLMYIYQSYKNTRPGQSNIFTSILRSYRADMLENANNTDRQMDAIKDSLGTILGRYKYSNIEVTVDHNEGDLKFLIDIKATTKSGVPVRLSDSVIFDRDM